MELIRITETGRIVNDAKELTKKALEHGQQCARPERVDLHIDYAELERRALASCGVSLEALKGSR